jgi:two-component system CheB/CheR fusion protein
MDNEMPLQPAPDQESQSLEETIATNQGQQEEAQPENDHQHHFSVVGIGASAGGLRALREFFDRMPADSGLAFVIVTHLTPDQVSHLPDLLQTHTAMPVVEVHQNIQIEINRVYVIPPNRYLSAIDSHLRLSKVQGEQRRPQAPIDHFFRTLADTRAERAIGIILSGTGSDGTVGIKQIKERGGLVVVQEPAEAEYDGMPQSAIGTGIVDFVLPLAEMPSRLIEFDRSNPRVPVPEDGEPVTETVRLSTQRILSQLRAHTGHDFTRYKLSTITRRIRRRMQIRQVDELPEYLQILRLNQEEVQALFKDLLITVTNFFRDRDAFEYLEHHIVPRLFQGKTSDDQVRVWIIGCATGEEAYSLAILLLEYANRLEQPPDIQLFASDIGDDALMRAREGLYPEAIAADVSPERLERFFLKEPGGYRVRKEVRDRILFAPHNILKDPPFSRLDLISCRNLLIYLKRDAQRQIFELFHYALRPEGYLFLGPAESVEGSELFREINKRHSLYQRTSTEGHLPTLPLVQARRFTGMDTAEGRREAPPSAVIHRQLLESYVAPSILVNADHNIVHISAEAGRYLHQPPGEPTNNILRRVLLPFRVELTTLLYTAVRQQQAARSKPIPVNVEGHSLPVSLVVYPATEPELHGYLLVVFEEEEGSGAADGHLKGISDSDSTLHEMSEELEQAKRQLQSTIEEFETSKEEMKAANEELQSINEELRSTAEELETSKEELQSMNEELVTVNQENRNKVEELSRLTSNLQNLLSATDIATLFLDRELRIKRFTPQVNELFNILTSDRGRPLSHLTHKLGYKELIDDSARVLKTLVPIEREIQSEDGRWHLTRLLPYRTLEDRIDGVVITFVDVTALKRAEQQLQRRAQQQAAVAALGQLALERTDIATLFEQTAQQIANTLGVDFSDVLEYQPDDEDPILQASYRLPEGDLGTAAARPKKKSPAIQNLQTHTPVVVANWTTEKKATPLAHITNQGITSTAYVAIPGSPQPYGLLGVHSRLQRSFTQNEVSFLQSVANLLAEAIGHQQVDSQLKSLNETLEQRVWQRTQQVQQLASELLFAEQGVRQRVAQVLHDDLQQLIFAIQIHVQVLAKELNTEPAFQEQLQQLESMVDDALSLTRNLSQDLSPPVMRSQDLGEALQWLAAHMKEMHDLEVALQLSSDLTIANDNLRLSLYQMVRELLFNVVKHAGVNHVQVRGSMVNGNLMLEIKDGGAGFDMTAVLQQQARDSSFGLRGMMERLKLLGGRMDIQSQPGQGTHITLDLPTRRGANKK